MSPRSGLALLLALVFALPAQKLPLTIDTIMRGPGLAGYAPRNVRWSGDGRKVYFDWKQHTDRVLDEFDTYVANHDGTGLRKLPDEDARLAPPFEGSLSHDATKIVSVRDGDVFFYDFAKDQGRRLTRTREPEGSAYILRDGRRVTFTKGGNLFVLSLESGELAQVTDIRPPGSSPPPGEEPRRSDGQEFLKKEERELLETVRERAEKAERQREKRLSGGPRKAHILALRQSVDEIQLAPGEKYAIATIEEAGEKERKTIVPAYVTESAFAETVPSRTNVGDAPTIKRLAIINVDTGELKWAEHGLKQPNPAPAEGKTAEPREVERAILFSQPLFSSDGKRAVVWGRAYDRKDRWIFALDMDNAKLRPIVTLHDDAWVGGPGEDTLGWMKNDEEIYFQWERDGYSHLYVAPHAGGPHKQLTSGNWEVLSARLSVDRDTFYLETNEVHPGERHLYSMKPEGGDRVRLTAATGQHEAVVSRDEEFIADIYSFTNKPPELHVQPNRPGSATVKVTTSPSPDFSIYPWQDPPIVQVPARDGIKVPGRLFKAARVGRRLGPAVIFVHGAGYLQNVHKGWSNYYREYMFHHLLVEKGYTVLDIDYRGSAGYGRDWRTAIYRHMGGKDLDDHVDAAKWLVASHGVDPKRIGIYGGSYGGFITLMGMFTQPEVFAAGAALRPVTDWAHYNEGYTSEILNLPHRDSEAYRRSSPIYFAAGLKGALLICHGMVDVNVHFQDSVRLAQKLIELRKENWELAVYPVEDHAFVQPTSWADEYKRIFKLFEEHLKVR